jgi:hypothetical protein
VQQRKAAVQLIGLEMIAMRIHPELRVGDLDVPGVERVRVLITKLTMLRYSRRVRDHVAQLLFVER